VNAIPYENHEEEDWDAVGDAELDHELPGRPRRQYFNRWTALLFAVVVGAAGFYAGIRVEKNQLAGSSSGTSLASAFASRLSGTGTTTGSASGASGRSGTSGASGASGASGFAGRFGGFGGFGGLGGGSAAAGTVSSVNGGTIYVQETSGNTVKVRLSSVTKITKSMPVTKAKVYPGDTVVIAGVTGKSGTVTATTITDSGVRATGSSSTGSSSTGSGSGSISSLF
jgi:hypothetical protein